MLERKKKKERNQRQDFERKNTRKNRKSRVGKSLGYYSNIICFKSLKRIERFDVLERKKRKKEIKGKILNGKTRGKIVNLALENS